jgi:hypothetical protein
VIFAEALTLGHRTATSDASVTLDRPHAKGSMLNAQIKNLAIVFVVADLARAHRFYSKTLGLAFEVEDFENGYLQARLPGDVEFVFLPGDAPRGATPQVVFGLAHGGSTRWSPR